MCKARAEPSLLELCRAAALTRRSQVTEIINNTIVFKIRVAHELHGFAILRGMVLVINFYRFLSHTCPIFVPQQKSR